MMGMGEPLQNYAALLPALRVMLDDHAYGLSRRRVTVSTSGVVPMIDRLARRLPGGAGGVAARAERRAARRAGAAEPQVPAARTAAACTRYLDAAPRDFITFEYCMLRRASTTRPNQAQQLVRLVRGLEGDAPALRCKMNLIPFNPFPESGLVRSPPQRVAAFADVLRDAGIVTTVRKTRGDDIAAACGQLAGEVMDRTQVQQRLRREPIRIHAAAGRRAMTRLGAIGVPVLAACAAAAGTGRLHQHRHPYRGQGRRKGGAGAARPRADQRGAGQRLELATLYYSRGQYRTALDEVKLAIQTEP